MDSLVMMKLGDFKFGVSTAAYQTLQRDTGWRWPTVDTVGHNPQAQFVGKGSDEVHLSGVIYPHFADAGLGQLDDIRVEANAGKPLILVDGMGLNWGRWAITNLREGQRAFFSNGAPRAQDFELLLLFVDLGPRVRVGSGSFVRM